MVVPPTPTTLLAVTVPAGPPQSETYRNVVVTESRPLTARKANALEVEGYNYDCSPAYYRDHVDMPDAARTWIGELETMYWKRPDLTEMDRWVLRNVLSIVTGNWDAFSRPENNKIPDEIKREINGRMEVDHPNWGKWPAQKMNRIRR